MNNLTKVAAIGVVVLSAVYAFTMLDSDEQPTKTLSDNTLTPKKAEQPIPPKSTQQKYLAPPSIDKPTNENLSAAAKVSPRQDSRMAPPPPPPISPNKTADAHHQKSQSHGHEHQQNDENNNSQPPPPRGADL